MSICQMGGIRNFRDKQIHVCDCRECEFKWNRTFFHFFIFFLFSRELPFANFPLTRFGLICTRFVAEWSGLSPFNWFNVHGVRFAHVWLWIWMTSVFALHTKAQPEIVGKTAGARARVDLRWWNKIVDFRANAMAIYGFEWMELGSVSVGGSHTHTRWRYTRPISRSGDATQCSVCASERNEKIIYSWLCLFHSHRRRCRRRHRRRLFIAEYTYIFQSVVCACRMLSWVCALARPCKCDLKCT